MEGSEEYTRVVLSVATPIQLWLSLITKVHTKFTLTAINSGNVCEGGDLKGALHGTAAAYWSGCYPVYINAGKKKKEEKDRPKERSDFLARERRRHGKSGPNEFIRIRQQLYLDPGKPPARHWMDITFAYNLRICRQPVFYYYSHPPPLVQSSCCCTKHIYSIVVLNNKPGQRLCPIGKRVSQLNTLLSLSLSLPLLLMNHRSLYYIPSCVVQGKVPMAE